MSFSIQLTAEQQQIIQQLGSQAMGQSPDAVGAWSPMYQYIADEIAAGRIDVPGINATSDEYYWFSNAAQINQNDLNSPSNFKSDRIGCF